MKFSSRLLMILAIITMLILAACEDTESDNEPSPTPPSISQASPTPQGAAPTAINTIGAFTQTAPTQGAAATGIVIPTSQTVPTSIAVVPSATVPPALNIAITSPAPGTVLRGSIAVTGSASHPSFVQYALEYGPDPNPGGLWYPITSIPITTPVINGILGGWNTTNVADGNYQLRLHLWLRNGAEEVRVVTGLQIRNVQVVTQQANRNPTIAPIGNITITRGKSITLALGMTDPDNDPLTYVAQVANPAITTVTPAGASAITLNGVQDGQTTVTINVSDQRGGTATVSFLVTIIPPPTTNNPPAITPIASRTINVGESIDISVLASDADPGDAVTLTVVSSATNIATTTLNNQTLRITGVAQGSSSITVTAKDKQNATSTVAFLITVQQPAPANREPVISAIGNQTVTAGSTVDVPMTISDPDNDPLTVEATSSDNAVVSAIVVNKNTLRLAAVTSGNASITVTARDGRGGIATATFSVTVNEPPAKNNPPTVQAIGNVSVEIGDTETVNVNASDPDGDDLSITATSSNPSVATLTLNGAEITISGVAVGTADVQVSVSDGTDTATTAFQITVTTKPNNAPTIGNIDNQTIGTETVSIPVNASDPDGDQLTLSATSANGAVATANIENNNVVVTGISGGSTDVTVSASDGIDTATETFTVTVNAAPPNEAPTIGGLTDLSMEPGASQNVSVSVSDPNNDNLTVSANSSDTSVADVSVNGSELTVTANGSGTASIIVSVTDGELSANASFNVNVSAANQAPAIQNIDDMSLNIGQSTDIQVNASDPDGDNLTLNASSDAGAVQVNLSNNILTVTGASEGSATVTVTASDGEQTATETFIVTVSPEPNQPPTIGNVPDQTVDVGQSTNASVTASDPDGDSLQFSVTAFNPAIAELAIDNNGTLTITGIGAGSTQGTITVTDGTDTASTTVNVNVNQPAPVNQPPTIQGPLDVTLDVGANQDVQVSASDPDGDPLTLEVSGFDPNIANVTAGSSSVSVTGVGAGSTQATITVNDGKGQTASTTLNITVNQPAPVNQPPIVNPIGDQQVEEGLETQVTVDASDPDGNPLLIDAQSSEQAFVTTSVAGNVITLAGVQPGNAVITVTVSDGTETVNTSFNVTVTPASQPPAFDVTQYPEIPTVDPVWETYIGGNNQRSSVSFAGDAPLNSPNFLPDPTTTTYELGNNTDLQVVFDFFPAEVFSRQSYATGDNWTINTLFDTNASSPDCQGQAPLQCELTLRQPAVVILSFTPASATSVEINQFRQQLYSAITTIRSGGAIPVLVTLPDDGQVSPDTLAAYNQVIVEVATDPNVNTPLWNLYNTMQGANAGVYNAAGNSPVDFSDAGLSGGVNRRNLAALRLLWELMDILVP